ncbi:MAG: 6-bladed beta-propeller [Candidatus Aminicenantes bacterium]|nr:6-bladed beta-propeller [Candidatus Aminicenantes bacterium]
MKNKTKTVLFILFFSVLIMAILSEGQKAKWEGTIEKEDGVKVIKNPKTPLYGEIELELEKDLVIGGEDVNENYMFRRVSDIEIDEEGNIYVLDSRECRIQIYDKDGKYLKTIGRKGEGPGEFQRAGRMTLSAKGKLYVNEYKKIIIFSEDGTFEKNVNTDFHLSSYLVTNEENFLGWSFIRTEEGNTLDVILIDSSGKRIDTIASFPDPSVVLTKAVSGGGAISVGGSPPYSPGLLFCPLSDELGIYGYSTEYKLGVVNSSGEIVFIIEKDEKRQPTSRKEENEYLEKMIERSKGGGIQWSRGDLRKLHGFAKYKPFFSLIMNDDEGHIFLAKPKPVVKEEEDTYFDFFNKEGYYLYKIKIHEISPKVIKKGYLYTFRQDEDTGYYIIERYKIKNWGQVNKKI